MQQVYSDNFGNMLMLPKLGPSLNPYCCLSALMKLGSAGLAKPTLPPPRPPPAPAPRPRPGILTEILQFVYKAPFQTKKNFILHTGETILYRKAFTSEFRKLIQNMMRC